MYFIKKVFISLVLLIIFMNCATTIFLQPTTGSKADGTVTMSYEYGIFQQPEIKWQDALNQATAKCQRWGYKSAEKFGAGLETCLTRNQYGNCIRSRVDVEYQCLD
jgi:hypothetical protein